LARKFYSIHVVALRALNSFARPYRFFFFFPLVRLFFVDPSRLPAPESGALQVHNGVSPILAQTYTQTFDVYSAKRFPGVPGEFLRSRLLFTYPPLSKNFSDWKHVADTTALSIAFGNQGQKLPLVRILSNIF
jgi:Velvet factor